MSGDDGLDGRRGPVAERRKKTNKTLALTLLGFVALVFLVTLTRLGANVAERPF